MKEFKRTDRVSEQIQKEIALLLQREIKDPRLRLTTVAAVQVTKDLKVAKVFVTFMEDLDSAEIQLRVDLLMKASGFIRSQLGKSLRMRAIPELRFTYDNSMTRGRELSSLIDQAMAKENQNEVESSAANGDENTTEVQDSSVSQERDEGPGSNKG